MTSSPPDTPHARIASWSASVPEPTPIELLVERADIRSDGELHAVEDFVDRLAHVVTDRGVLCAKVDERDLLRCYGGHVLIAPSFIRPPSRARADPRARSTRAGRCPRNRRGRGCPP